MARKKQLIIPVFIPFAGCREQCVFCNQGSITGKETLPTIEEVRGVIKEYLSTWRGGGPREVAFYGGSFTALDKSRQEQYLRAAYAFVEEGRIDALRVSTRPDCVSVEAVSLLKKFKVETVELGVQSFSDEVLELSGRGHSSSDAITAVKLLKAEGLKVGIQLMPGLPGDTEERVLQSAKKAASLGPDFVRVYPTLVIKETPLEEMYLKGLYEPWELPRMVSVCKEVMRIFDEAGVKVIRVGLHPTEELRRSVVAGPFHPSFRDLVAM